MKGRNVEKQYRRVTDIDEKIKNVSLPYFYWKVLFLVLEETNIDELVKTLNSDEKTVQEALDSLEQNGILESDSVGVDTVDEIPEEVVEESKEEIEPIEEILEESEESKEEPEEVVAEIISETVEDIEETKTEELDEPIAELLDEVVEEPEEESELIIEEESEKQPEELEEPTDQVLEDLIEEEFKIEETEEKEEETKEPESEGINLETLEDTLEETAEVETTEDDESTDISSFIDDLGGEEELDAPQQEAVKEELVKEEKPKAKSSANVKTIMVVDDSIVIRKMVEIALEDGDYNIVTSNSGKDGLTLLDEENPDLVIVDMTLPDMNGIDLLKTVKASKGIPVIMLSGKDAPQLIESAKAAGADDFLPKPFRDDDLIEKVKNLTK
jgi:CheY-like chemotaxis protein